MTMKKRNQLVWISALMLAVFILLSLWVFQLSSARIRKGFLASEGSAAENFAVLTAENIHLTDAQVAQLKSYTYSELLSSDENRALTQMMGSNSFATKVDYAYVMIHLKGDDISYAVTEENKSRFDAPVGTALDIMWLLDVNVSDSAAQNEMNTADSELNRYSYYIEEDAMIFGEVPTYIYNASEWGDHICGYAPLYSQEGTYIGAVGVELQVSDYDAYCGSAIGTMGALMGVTLLMLTLVFITIYIRNRRMQLNRVYTDGLTGIYNRSYYNDTFIRQMNANRHTEKTFALMIMDIDLFKKVNDTFGHAIGDAVLVEMSEILLQVFDKKQIIRFGGEEFVAGIWLDKTEELTEKLDRLFALIREHRFSSQQISVSISLGCSTADMAELNGWLLSGMLRAADCKLYECKENGRCQYRVEEFDPHKEYKK